MSYEYNDEETDVLEKPAFDVEQTIEQRPFRDKTTQQFFGLWCEANDSIIPSFVSREEWQYVDKEHNMKKRSDGKFDLFIPNDLKLWEMIDVIEAVDKNTFSDSPERQLEGKNKVLELGKTFQNAGTYIAQRLDSIAEGKEIASELSKQFFEYGKSILQRDKSEEISLDEISQATLSDAELEKVDRFLAGDDLYNSRMKKIEARTQPDSVIRVSLVESEREETLAQFFRVAQEAIDLKEKEENGELRPSNEKPKAWERGTSVHKSFLETVNQKIDQNIELPKAELGTTIFRRGMEFLRKYMKFDTLPEDIKNEVLHWEDGEQTLHDALQMDRLKNELDEVRKTNDPVKIGQKEREITDKIQRAVSSYNYEEKSNYPSVMVRNEIINCLGASELGGSLMQELGLNYLVAELPGHSMLFLVTSDDHVEYRDMVSKKSNLDYKKDLSDELIDGKNPDGSPIKVSDIIEFSKNLNKNQITFEVKGEEYLKKFQWIKDSERKYVTLFHPLYGQGIELLNNLGNALLLKGNYELAIESFKQAIAINPNSATLYLGLAGALAQSGNSKEAMETYKHSILLDPKQAMTYSNFAVQLHAENRYNEELDVLRKVVEVNPNDSTGYSNLSNFYLDLGNETKAKEAIQEGITANPKEVSLYFNLATLYYKQDRENDAIISGINTNPLEATLYVGLSSLYEKLNEEIKAIDTLKEGIMKNPSDTTLYMNLGSLYSRLDRESDSLEQFKKIVEIEPNNPSCHFFLAASYENSHEYLNAINEYRKFISIGDKNDKEEYGYMIAAERKIKVLQKQLEASSNDF